MSLTNILATLRQRTPVPLGVLPMDAVVTLPPDGGRTPGER
ncbi:MAG: hypothetical protein JWP18_1897 [Solirubrobacterales bacterium]|jgi:hypothetical protein|nr:hypothetical protein [Solirubrobacterales bacterium]